METKYVIREANSKWFSDNGVLFYIYSHGLGFNPSCYFRERDIKTAEKYAFNTYLGAESSILYLKRHCVCPTIDILDYQKNHTKDETRAWLDEKVREYDWENSDYSFTIITLDEMLEEIRDMGKAEI